MGLDMYMMKEIKDSNDEGATIEIGYWRKFRHLHNWMESKWVEKGNSGEFNCERLYMSHELLDELEETIANYTLLEYDKGGLFFGNYDEITLDDENYLLDVILESRKALDRGFSVFYDSWW